MAKAAHTAPWISITGALLLHGLIAAWLWQVTTPELRAKEETEQITWVELTQVAPPPPPPVQSVQSVAQPVEKVIEKDPLAEEVIKKPEIEKPQEPPKPKEKVRPEPKKPLVKPPEKPVEKGAETPPTPAENTQSSESEPPPVERPLQKVATESVPASAPPEEPLIEARADYLNNPLPHYPRLSKRAGEEGTVILKVRVSASGEAKAVELHTTSGYTRLDKAALEAVKKWQFSPAKQGSANIESTVLVPVKFVLQNA